MSYLESACQNAKVWARRLGVDYDRKTFIGVMDRAGFNGSVLKGPLAIMLFKVVNTHSSLKTLNKGDKRTLSVIGSHAMADLVRGDANDLPLAMANHTQGRNSKVLMIKHGHILLKICENGLEVRQAERRQRSVTDVVLGKLTS